MNKIERESEQTAESRRGFLKFLGVSSAGMALASAATASKEKNKKGWRRGKS